MKFLSWNYPSRESTHPICSFLNFISLAYFKRAFQLHRKFEREDCLPGLLVIRCDRIHEYLYLFAKEEILTSVWFEWLIKFVLIVGCSCYEDTDNFSFVRCCILNLTMQYRIRVLFYVMEHLSLICTYRWENNKKFYYLIFKPLCYFNN